MDVRASTPSGVENLKPDVGRKRVSRREPRRDDVGIECVITRLGGHRCSAQCPTGGREYLCLSWRHEMGGSRLTCPLVETEARAA